jgi:hypothetical protein
MCLFEYFCINAYFHNIRQTSMPDTDISQNKNYGHFGKLHYTLRETICRYKECKIHTSAYVFHLRTA